MVERQFSKLLTRVRFPSPAPSFCWSFRRLLVCRKFLHQISSTPPNFSQYLIPSRSCFIVPLGADSKKHFHEIMASLIAAHWKNYKTIYGQCRPQQRKKTGRDRNGRFGDYSDLLVAGHRVKVAGKNGASESSAAATRIYPSYQVSHYEGDH